MQFQSYPIINTQFYHRQNAINLSTIGLSPREPGMQRCEPYLSFSAIAMSWFLEDFLTACECVDGGDTNTNPFGSCKDLDWDPEAGTLICKQTVPYVFKYYGQRFPLGSGVWKMEPKIEGHYCNNIFKLTRNLAASCH